jgi:hypothetical protein
MIKRIAFLLSIMILTSCEIEEEGKCHLYCYRSDGNIYVVSGDYEIEVSEKECSNICKTSIDPLDLTNISHSESTPTP